MGGAATLTERAGGGTATRTFVKMLPMPVRDHARDEDGRLAERIRDGDPEALRLLHERLGRITFGFLLQALGDRGAAEDVQQQVFTEVWQRADSYDPSRAALTTWVMTIARSRAIDQLRRRVPEPRDPEATTAAAGGEATIDRIVEQWHMRELLDRLPDQEAALLRRRFYGGLSQAEIAERDGIPLGTVKTRMVSGLRRLRELIDEEGDDDGR